MSRLAAILWIFSAAMIAVVLFLLKHEVQSLERELQMVNRQVIADQEAIHVLKAEWSFLNQPARIADLAQRHLQLQPLDTARIIEFDQVPGRPIPGIKPEPPLHLGTKNLAKAESFQ